MNCHAVKDLLHAYLDEELDTATTGEVKQHLRTCPACSQAYTSLRALQQVLHTNNLSLPAPASLRERVQLAVYQEDQVPFFQRSVRFWLSALVAILVLTVLIFTQFFASSSYNTLTQQVLASHIHALQQKHLVDVSSSDQHAIKPWFDGKLAYSPPIVDLAAEGFPLVGGRLDYLDRQSVATLVYQHNQHVITLFLWPAQGTEGITLQTLQGYHLCSWTRSGMTYWATSDVDISQLHQFVILLQQKVAT